MPNILRDAVKWSGDNQMNINWGKTKEILVSMNSPNLLSDALCVDDNVIERVYSYKLLGSVIQYNHKWHAHVDQISPFSKDVKTLIAHYR